MLRRGGLAQKFKAALSSSNQQNGNKKGGFDWTEYSESTITEEESSEFFYSTQPPTKVIVPPTQPERSTSELSLFDSCGSLNSIEDDEEESSEFFIMERKNVRFANVTIEKPMKKGTTSTNGDNKCVPKLYNSRAMDVAENNCADFTTAPSLHYGISTDTFASSVASKHVQFDEMCDIVSIQRVDDIDPSLVSKLWYDENDFQEIRNELSVLIQDMEVGHLIDSSEHTYRGLESRTQEGKWDRYKRRRDVLNAVLDEQDRQRDTVVKNADHEIMLVSQSLSLTANQQARLQGIQDRKATKDYVKRLAHNLRKHGFLSDKKKHGDKDNKNNSAKRNYSRRDSI